MPITMTCVCGQQLKARDEFAGRKARCRACGAILLIAAPTVFVPIDTKARATGLPTPSQPKPPFYRDRVVLIGAAIPTLILIAFFAYLNHQKTMQAEHELIVTLKGKGDALAKEGRDREAYSMYEAAVREYDANPIDESQVRAEVNSAKAAIRKLAPGVRAEIDREKAVAREEGARASRTADHLLELAKLSNMAGQIKGKVFVTMKSGTTQTLKGLSVSLLKAELPKAELSTIIESLTIAEGVRRSLGSEQVLTDDEFAFFQDSIDKAQTLKNDPDYTLVDVRLIYAIVRVNLFIGKKNGNRPFDEAWKATVKKARVAQVFTTIEGDFKFEDVPGGYYYLCAEYQSGRNIIEWVTPIDVKKPGVRECDLHNNVATLLLNIPAPAKD